jgi:hypothetical protein
VYEAAIEVTAIPTHMLNEQPRASSSSTSGPTTMRVDDRKALGIVTALEF